MYLACGGFDDGCTDLLVRQYVRVYCERYTQDPHCELDAFLAEFGRVGYDEVCGRVNLVWTAQEEAGEEVFWFVWVVSSVCLGEVRGVGYKEYEDYKTVD